MHLELCWTGPVDNTPMQAKIAFGKVANVAVDLYCDASRAKLNTMQPATKPAPTDAGQEGASCPQPSRSVYEDILGQENLPWRIPISVEKGFEIPICVTNAFAVPELGKFKRLGMDVVVNATWLAYHMGQHGKEPRICTSSGVPHVRLANGFRADQRGHARGHIRRTNSNGV